ncbi:MAG: hypothetical protein AAFX87_31685 [Bacteroidota bacterium]
MLYLYKNEKDAFGDRVLSYLEDISAAHRKVAIDEGESFIKENDIIIKGQEAVFRYLEAFSRTLEHERSISADACYIDPDTGETC